MIYIPTVSDPVGGKLPTALSVKEQTGHVFYHQSPSSRSLDNWQMKQSEDYETARFTASNYNELSAIATSYHDDAKVYKRIIVIKDGIKTTTTYIIGQTEPEIVTEETEEEDGRWESREGTMVQSTITSMNGGMWELTLRLSSVFWDKPDDKDEDSEELDEDDEAYDEDGDEIPGNSREYPTVQVSCSMEETSILNHEKLRQLGSDEKAAISALLSGASKYDQIKVGAKKYKTIEDILDFNLGDGMGNCLSFVLANPTFSVPVTHISYRYKADNPPDLPEQGKAVDGNMLPGQLKQAEGYICIFVGAGYEYRKGAPIFYEEGEEHQKKYDVEENYVVFYGRKELYK